MIIILIGELNFHLTSTKLHHSWISEVVGGLKWCVRVLNETREVNCG